MKITLSPIELFSTGESDKGSKCYFRSFVFIIATGLEMAKSQLSMSLRFHRLAELLQL